MKARLVLALATTLLLNGCIAVLDTISALQPTIVTTIPLYSSVISVVNSTPDLVMDIIQDGCVVQLDMQPGQYYAAKIPRLLAQSVQTTITVRARDTAGRLIGTAVRSFWVSEYHRSSESWPVRRYELRL